MTVELPDEEDPEPVLPLLTFDPLLASIVASLVTSLSLVLLMVSEFTPVTVALFSDSAPVVSFTATIGPAENMEIMVLLIFMSLMNVTSPSASPDSADPSPVLLLASFSPLVNSKSAELLTVAALSLVTSRVLTNTPLALFSEEKPVVKLTLVIVNSP